MDKDRRELSADRLQKAKNKFRVAEKLLAMEEFEDAVSRAYYAAFHAAQALLIAEGFKAQSHSGVKTLFHLHFIKTKRLDSKFGRYLSNLKDDREDSDYDAVSAIDSDVAMNAIREARELLAGIEQLLQSSFKE